METEECICFGFLFTLEHAATVYTYKTLKCVRFACHIPVVQVLLWVEGQLTLTCVSSAPVEKESVSVSFSDRASEGELPVSNDFCDGRHSFHHPSIPPTPHKLPLILTGCIKTMQRVRALI